MAQDFNKFFNRKNLNIRNGFDLTDRPLGMQAGEVPFTSVLEAFSPLTANEIRELIRRTSNAFCAIDPVPTWFVKERQDILIKLMTKIVNMSFLKGVFPRSMKTALVKLLIKKSSSDCNILNNYRPISNLPFLSKLIERAVAIRLKKYLFNNNLNELQLSAYKCDHSTEPALIRVKNDIMMSIDQHKAVVLVLLDLSAAFDTIDHGVLFSRLKVMFRLSGNVLD